MPAAPESATPGRIRSRATYRMFNDLLEVVQSGNQRAVLMTVHRIIDARRGFRSQRNSDCAMQSLDLVMQDALARETTSQRAARMSIENRAAAAETAIPENSYVTHFARDYGIQATAAEIFGDVVADTVPPVDASFASENTLGNFPRR